VKKPLDSPHTGLTVLALFSDISMLSYVNVHVDFIFIFLLFLDGKGSDMEPRVMRYLDSGDLLNTYISDRCSGIYWSNG